MKPDFRLRINDHAYYIEHLGNMNNQSYRERWLRKLQIYKNLGLAETLITTSESQDSADIEENVKKIIQDIKLNQLKKTQGYSLHHYEI